MLAKRTFQIAAIGMVSFLLSVSSVNAQLDHLQQSATGKNSGDRQPDPAAAMGSLSDHLAKVFDFQGHVRILKQGSSEWIELRKEMIIREGDQILTAGGAYVDVAYDDQFMNIARVEENTKAVFRSIEPTDLYLEDGTIFNAIDHLSEGKSYQVSTPTAVAAVRGTHFEVGYIAASEIFSVDVFPDTKDYMSELEITPVLDGIENAARMFLVEEGQHAYLDPEILTSGQDPIVEPINPETLTGLSKKRGQMMRIKKGDDHKPVQGPHDGGDGTDVDALLDKALDPQHLNYEHETDQQTSDYDSMMEFFRVAGEEPPDTKMNHEKLNGQMTDHLSDMEFDPEFMETEPLSRDDMMMREMDMIRQDMMHERLHESYRDNMDHLLQDEMNKPIKPPPDGTNDPEGQYP